MRVVSVDRQRRRAVVEPGATRVEVDAVTGPYELSPRGLVSTTGAAVWTLGGGIRWLQRRYGLACENLRSAVLVTANVGAIGADEELL
jgi:FAD/FMN-containing dehydrogenase